MRTIERTSRFKRDYRRESRGRHRNDLDERLALIVNALAHDISLDVGHDHALSGDWSNFRDCHVWPDLVLIYEKPDSQTLRLVRLGSHSELGYDRRGRSSRLPAPFLSQFVSCLEPHPEAGVAPANALKC